jgi:hypothetical protein
LGIKEGKKSKERNYKAIKWGQPPQQMLAIINNKRKTLVGQNS